MTSPLTEIEQRHRSEKDFHEKKFSGERKQNYYSQGFLSLVRDQLLLDLGDIREKKVLEIGCGKGWFTRVLATKGALVWAFDISDEAVRSTREHMTRSNLQGRVQVQQMSAESLQYDSDMFDVVVGNAILHHLDLNLALGQIQRVLKKGGRGHFMEPLGHNLLLNIYRNFTPNLRTVDEEPLRFEQFGLFSNKFSTVEHEEFYFTALLALVWYYLGARGLMMMTRDLLNGVDKRLLRLVPWLRRLCWYTVITVTK